jgi:hypothetical protein
MTVLDDRALLLKLERDIEHLQDQFDRHGEEGDEVTNGLLGQLRLDVVDLFDRLAALDTKVSKLQHILTEYVSD